MNARRAPEGIGEGHGADELGDLRIDGRTTGSTAPRLPVPERAEALPVPANHGLRLNDMERLAPPCPPLRATARRRGRGDRPEVAWSGGGAWRPIFWPTTGFARIRLRLGCNVKARNRA